MSCIDNTLNKKEIDVQCKDNSLKFITIYKIS